MEIIAAIAGAIIFLTWGYVVGKSSELNRIINLLNESSTPISEGSFYFSKKWNIDADEFEALIGKVKK